MRAPMCGRSLTPSVPTYALTHWARDKAEDDPKRLPLEFVVKKLTHDGARLFGMQGPWHA